MNIAQIEENVKALLAGLHAEEVKQDDFIYELLLAYGHRKQSVTRLRSGERNLVSKSNDPYHNTVIWKRHLYYKHVEGDALHAEIDEMRKEKLVASNKIRFVIVTNFDQLLAVDTKTSDSLDINLDELAKQFDFFLPWGGMEKAVYQGENPADVKAAEKMAKLFDLIKGDNFDESNRDDKDALHNLNVFLTRLLFCFFAEDTEIFEDNQFSLAIQSHTKDDGSDLSSYLDRLFFVLNTADSNRGELPDYLANFPYVNGGLFADDIPSPIFSAKSRRMLIECGSELDWSDINPDIFGSMIQAVVHPDQRGGMGMHYTSVTNIMKVIEPLFLNDLYEELEKVEASTAKLKKLQQRLGEIKIFDPACGSGNFLIIAYKELRKLEMEILKRLQELELEKTGQISQPFSVIKLSQFYGIELDDFAHEVAILSLWLAEHQMNNDFRTEFGDSRATLPLEKSGNIVCDNSNLLNWESFIGGSGEIFILGNPPYLGSKVQNDEQKSEVKDILGHDKFCKTYDYILCWFYKAAAFIRGKSASFSFVSTNSICQGEQVRFWHNILNMNLEIGFCHTSFKWKNNAKSNAGVICVIVGVRNTCSNNKYIFTGSLCKKSENINPYLVDADGGIIERVSSPVSSIPPMLFGSIPYDGGNLILTNQEKKGLVESCPDAMKYIRPAIGASELIKGIDRWCLWIGDDQLEDALLIPEIKNRVEAVKKFRLSSKTASTQRAAEHSHRFKQYTYKESTGNLILVPRVSSERREYLPIRFFPPETVTVDAQVIYDAPAYLFGILSSRMHMAWVRVTSGRLKTDYRYSSAVTYNNFPLPDLQQKIKNDISDLVMKIISVRESYPDRTLASLYDPDKMPDDLRREHEELDRLIDSAFNPSGFESDEQRLQCLFKLHSKIAGSKYA